MLRYIDVMGSHSHRFNFTVTALVLTVWFSIPVAAASLDDLFEDLATADAQSQPRIEGQIITQWERSGSAAMDFLLRRGKKALEEGNPELAVEHFSALVDHAPNFAEGYHSRATSYYLMGLIGPALDDLRQTLVLNPRHFGAMRGLGVIFEDLAKPEQALEAYRAVLALNPASPDVNEAVKRLELQLEGQSL